RDQATLCRARPEPRVPNRSEVVDAAGGSGFAGDQMVKDRSWRWSDRRLPLQCLHPRAQAVQLNPQALEVLSAERQSSEQQWPAAAAAATGPDGLWPTQGCVAQSFRGGPAPARSQWLPARLSSRARTDPRCPAGAFDRTAEDCLYLESDVDQPDTFL